MHLCNSNVYFFILDIVFAVNLFTIFNVSVILLNIYQFFIMAPEAERFDEWAAIIGFVAAIGAYVSTGQIIPRIF